MQKDKYISFDWAMKRMLRDKANFAVLEGLLTVLLNEQITILAILESEGNQETPDDKFNRVDIKVRDSHGRIVIVEIQNTHEVAYMERILYGVSKTITEYISMGDGYEKVQKVISISIVYFDLGKGADYLYHGTTHFIGVNTKDELQMTEKQRGGIVRKVPDDIFPEYYIIRVNEFNQVARTPLEEWVRYLRTGIIEDDDTAPGLSEARQKLRYYDMSPAERHAFDEHINAIRIQNDVMWSSREEGLEIGLKEGRKKGLEEGRKEGRKEGRDEAIAEAAAAMKHKGFDVATIADITGLTEEQIASL